MKSREQRERELIDSGLVDSVKAQFRNVNHNISDKYFILMADYIDSIGQLDFEGGLYLDPVNVAKSLPQLLSSVMDVNLGGIHGRTTDDEITNIVNDNFDLRPAAIIKNFDLRRPIYKQTAAYGHFGRNDLDLPWEKTDKTDVFKKYIK